VSISVHPWLIMDRAANPTLDQTVLPRITRINADEDGKSMLDHLHTDCGNNGAVAAPKLPQSSACRLISALIRAIRGKIGSRFASLRVYLRFQNPAYRRSPFRGRAGTPLPAWLRPPLPYTNHADNSVAGDVVAAYPMRSLDVPEPFSMGARKGSLRRPKRRPSSSERRSQRRPNVVAGVLATSPMRSQCGLWRFPPRPQRRRARVRCGFTAVLPACSQRYRCVPNAFSGGPTDAPSRALKGSMRSLNVPEPFSMRVRNGSLRV
jgi:hypothetical protein